MSYFFSNPKLTNDVHLITQDDINMMNRENDKDIAECNMITQSSYKGENFYGITGNFLLDFFNEVLYRDAKTDGFMRGIPMHGVIIKQAERNHYYRGENQIYPSSLPSLNRKLNMINNEEERKLYKIIADMRIYEFKKFLFTFEHVQFWHKNYGDVLFESLAQHYGFPTHWLDITNDFMCALFFATCYYDCDKKRWNPLTKKQTEICENKKYGMIFHIPRWKADTNLYTKYGFSNNLNDKSNIILPIGFQPFRRCHMQYGYGIYMPEDSPLQSDIYFEKLKFRHDEKLSEEIFNKMDDGKLIYPHEGLTELNDIICQIINTTKFSEESFEYAFQNNTNFNDKSKCRLLLEQYGNKNIVIGNEQSFSLSKEQCIKIDKLYEGFTLEKDYGINITKRLIYRPPN